MPTNAITDVNEILTALQTLCEAEQEKMLQLLTEKSQEIACKIQPLYEKRRRLKEDCEYIAEQINILNAYIANPTAWTEVSLNAKFQESVARIIEESVCEYGRYIAERDFVIRENQFVELKSKEAKEQEILNFRSNYVAHAMQVYGQYTFKTNSDLKGLQETLQQAFKCHQQEYDIIFEEYVNTLTSLQKEQYCLEQSMKHRHAVLQAQKQAFTAYAPTPLEILCIQSSIQALQIELAKFKNPKEYLLKTAPNALHYACWLGSLETVALLINAGVDVNAPDTITGTPTSYYPIHYVAMREDKGELIGQYLTTLCASGCDFTIKDKKYGRTALHTAALFGNRTAVNWLINEADMRLSTTDAQTFISQQEQGPFQRNTAVRNAAFEGHLEILTELLKKNADCTLLTFSGNTPLMELLCGQLSNEVKYYGMTLFYHHGQSLSQDNLAKLKMCIHPHYEEEILPVLQMMRDKHPALMAQLGSFAIEEAPNQASLLAEKALSATAQLASATTMSSSIFPLPKAAGSADKKNMRSCTIT